MTIDVSEKEMELLTVWRAMTADGKLHCWQWIEANADTDRKHHPEHYARYEIVQFPAKKA